MAPECFDCPADGLEAVVVSCFCGFPLCADHAMACGVLTDGAYCAGCQGGVSTEPEAKPAVVVKDGYQWPLFE